MTGTSPGVIVGTVGYMSPEQASAGPLDFRSDQFALGSMLYEMATGRKAFQKATAVETLSAILREEPEPIGRVSPETPAPLRWLVERCLVKEPDGRYASTKDLARELAGVRDHSSELASGIGGGEAPLKRKRLRLWWTLAALGVAVALALAFRLGDRLRKIDPPSYQRLTFRRGSNEWARFAPDGQTIIYAAAWEREPTRLYSTRVDSPESRVLDLPEGTSILAISRLAEMAVSLRVNGAAPSGSFGTLARVPLAGGAAREVLEEVNSADFSPDGKELAVIRRVAGKRRLEFPIGKVLYENDGIFWLRVSPRGDSIAFLEQTDTGRNICLIDLAGHKRVLFATTASPFMLAWSPKGDEVWYAGRDLRKVSLSGHESVLLRFPEPTWAHLNDISADGRVLVVLADYRNGIIALPPGESRERDISWQGYSTATDLTPDGKMVLFGDNGGTYMRRSDGASLAVRVGGDDCFAMSPDAKWILCTREGAGSELLVSPTGPGESKVLSAKGLELEGGVWFPDGLHVLVRGRESGRPWRSYVFSLDGGAPRAVTPEGAFGRALSPDGRLIAVKDPERRIVLYPVEGGQARTVPGEPEPGDIAGWSSDGKTILVSDFGHVFRRDIETGSRQAWKELMPSDPAGIFGLNPIFSRDGNSYVYTYARWISNLYIIKGLK